MSDKLLEALVQLFAVVASVRVGKDMSDRRMVVYRFLLSQLNSELANKYISKFDDYYRANVRLGLRSENQYKTISRISSRVMRIAVEMSKELSLYQKYIVLVQLYEYLNTGQISYVEQGLIDDIVADKFNIDTEQFELVRNFILDPNSVSRRIIFTGKEDCENTIEPKHVYWEDLDGELMLVYLQDINVFLFKYTGGQKLDMNGQKIEPGRSYILIAGSSIRNGVSSPIFYYDMMHHAVANDSIPVSIEARNVVYHFNKKLIGIHNLSFESHSGLLVGVMGISGSGKSTFANIISGMARPSSGNVYINNIDIYEDPEKIKGLIGYVTQDDILIEDLTVYDNLYFCARMSFSDMPLAAIEDRIDQLLRLLGLYDIRHVKVGSPLNKKISGGQRKRLNIALELIREPSILILDEPTSGLSSHDSENIIELLKDLTINGKLVFVVIHQPSSDIFKMFDQLLILDTGGYLIYDGNPIESLNYFRLQRDMVTSDDVICPRCGNIKVEEILDIISQPVIDEYGNNTDKRKVTPEEWFDKRNWGNIETAYVGDPEPLPPVSFKTPGRLEQCMLYLQRDFKSKVSNLQYMLLNMLETPVMALLVSVILRYYDTSTGAGYTFAGNNNMPVYLIVSVIIAFFVGLTVSAEEIIQDRQVLRRERFLNLSRSSYIFSKCAQTTFLSAIQMFFYVIIANSILGVEDMYFDYWLVLFSTAVSANLLGLNLSDMLKRTINIYIVIPFMVIPQLILSGVFVKFDNMNPDLSSSTEVPAFGNIIVARWAFEALAVNQFCYNKYETLVYTYDKARSQSSFYKDYWVPAMRARLNRVTKNSSDAESDPVEQQRVLTMLRDEIQDKAQIFPGVTPPRADMFTVGLFGEAAYNVTNQYLESIRKLNVDRYNTVDVALDEYRRTFARGFIDSLRTRYDNKSITDLVCNPSGLLSDVIIERENRLWQKNDMVFQNTDKSFAAPLYTSYKCFNGHLIDTYLFDTIIIWVINLIFFIILIDGRLGEWMKK